MDLAETAVEAVSTIYYACYTFLTTSPKLKATPASCQSNRMFFLNTVVYDNSIQFNSNEERTFQNWDHENASN